MAARLPRRPTTGHLSLSSITPQTTAPTSRFSPATQFQTRNATLIKRERRPYTFTQIVQLSDGSTYTCRTTSPVAMYKSTRDARNHILWNPSEKALRNVEVDEAGKLAAFRSRFGRGWDAKQAGEEDGKKGDKDGGSSLEDILTRYAIPMGKEKAPAPAPKPKKK